MISRPSSHGSGGRNRIGKDRRDVGACAPVIVGRIDFDPGKPAMIDDRQAAALAEAGEGGGYFYQQPHTRGGELRDADTFAVGFAVAEGFRNLGAAAVSDTKLHLLILVRVRLVAAPERDEQRVLIAAGHEIR